MKHNKSAALETAMAWLVLAGTAILALLCCVVGIDANDNRVTGLSQDDGTGEYAVEVEAPDTDTNADVVSSPPIPPQSDRDQEAELIALYLSGELRAPEALYNQVHADLEAIRSTFGSEYSAIRDITFRPPWVPGCLILGLDEFTARQVACSEYHAWDALNQKYGIKDVSAVSSGGWVLLSFQDRLHPERLAELYDGLPGVKYAEPNHYVGDSSNVYVGERGQGLAYLFRLGWGDCPAGCIHNEYWYFVVEEGQPSFIGHRADGEAQPEWWDKAPLR